MEYQSAAVWHRRAYFVKNCNFPCWPHNWGVKNWLNDLKRSPHEQQTFVALSEAENAPILEDHRGAV